MLSASLTEAEEIKNGIREAVRSHLRNSLRNLRNRLNLSRTDLDPENRFSQANRGNSDALSPARSPGLGDILATTQRICTDIINKGISDEERIFIEKFKQGENIGASNKEILAFLNKG